MTHNRTGSPRKLQSLLGSANPWSQSSNPKTEGSGSCYTQHPAVAPAEKRCRALLLGTYKPEPGPWGLCHSHRKQDPSSAQFPWIKSGHSKTPALCPTCQTSPTTADWPGFNPMLTPFPKEFLKMKFYSEISVL